MRLVRRPRARKARWRLARRNRTVARGTARVRRGRAVLRLGRLAALPRRNYRLTVTIGRGANQLVVRHTVRLR